MELKKKEERQKKADAAKKKEENDRWWREQKEREWKKEERKTQQVAKKDEKALTAVINRAFKEGVIEAQEHTDGLWYIEVAKNTWKEVQHAYWCPHCEASCNESNLQSHLEGQNHMKKMAWATGGVVTGAAPSAPSRSPAAAAPVSYAYAGGGGNGKLERWQELRPDGMINCLACSRVCDGNHELTADHHKRVQNYLGLLDLADKDYPAPPQPWLAYLEDPSFGEGKFLKCLLCAKWVNDWTDASTAGYIGNHGDKGALNQKDHAKKLNNLEYYLKDLATEKAKWHKPVPSQSKARAALPPSGAPPAAAPWAKAAASATTPVCPPAGPPAGPPPGRAMPPPPAKGPGAPASGPKGWGPQPGKAAPKNAWGPPPAAAPAALEGPPAPGPPPAPTLPDGWKTAKSPEGVTYYYHGAHVQWDFPTFAIEEA